VYYQYYENLSTTDLLFIPLGSNVLLNSNKFELCGMILYIQYVFNNSYSNCFTYNLRWSSCDNSWKIGKTAKKDKTIKNETKIAECKMADSTHSI
jgi:hypothetical protein